MIGIFDSGIGGISIYRILKEGIQNTQFLYYADQKHFPYGEKSESQIQQYSVEITKFLVDKGAGLIVIACNSATISSIKYLRETFSIPFIGTVPAVKPAAQITKTGKIAVLLTHSASNGFAYQELVSQWTEGVQVFTVQIPKVVHLVENNLMEIQDSKAYLYKQLDDLEKLGVDTIVLGCTHFIFLRSIIKEKYEERFNLMDPSIGVMNQTKKIYELFPRKPEKGRDFFYTSGDQEKLSRFLAQWIKPGTYETFRAD